MRIKKVLNNNAVIILDEDQEKIAIGAGVAFNKGKNDIVNPKKIEKLFVLKENEKLQQLLLRIPEEHFILSEEIIAHAEKQLGIKLNEHISLALTDHLSFAIERESQGIHLKNKLLQEIKILYKEEFDIGLWALRLINDKLGIEMPIDEAAFIALHIHTMKIQGGDLHETVRQTAILRDMVETIQNYLEITIKQEDLAYERLITHLRFALTRAHHYEAHTMDAEMLSMIKKKFEHSYRCAMEVRKELASLHGIDLPEEELGYISLHIERLRKYEM
ncbi:transcriptional antiterminator, BglG family [Oceanobacillus limi]|uniref:Transcriptional antiterminator, BglG family n=1 Tax=Oceanobacillus limi TaxID=930131 RepID=A0A1I0FB01_9BACI|nr:PRD domain-containing protein [Oceanobacillus limi]SET55016.1 transcriptional antiterminator, BglG family [Oceanobacillus limi]